MTTEQYGEHRGLRSFVIACLFIIVVTAISMFGIIQLAARFPDVIPWRIDNKISGSKLPADIPLYQGAVLKESTSGTTKQTFSYILPLGAESTVRNYYEGEMLKTGWTRLAGDENLLVFFKEGGKRRVSITINYLNGKANVAFDITNGAK